MCNSLWITWVSVHTLYNSDQVYSTHMYIYEHVHSRRHKLAPKEPSNYDNNEAEKSPVVFLPYVAGVSERIRKVCQDFNIRAVFKSGPTLHNLLTKVKDPLRSTNSQMSSTKYHALAARCTSARPSAEYNEAEKPPVVFLPYVAGVSERIRKVCQDFNIRAVFKSGPTLRSLLTKVKDPLPIDKQSNVVYEVPCTCGKVYIGETKRRLGTRLKEHKDACVKCHTDKSAIAEHAWTNDHPINWAETKILQRANGTMELVMKEALSIRTTPEDACLNRHSGYELPDCWIATYKKLKGGASLSSAHRARTNARAPRSGMRTNQN